MSGREPGRLTQAPGRAADVLVRGARVLDPGEGIDAVLDVLVQGGEIAGLGEALDAPAGLEVIEAGGCTLLPAFIDPHVHLRTPGQEHKEDVATGTAAAAAGGYCSVLAMPNTDPVVDSPQVLDSLHERAAVDARVRVGFLAAISLGQAGEQMAPLGELADYGACGYSDDGRPVLSASLLRRTLQYAATTGRVLSLHCEDTSLSRAADMHEGAVCARLGLVGYPAIAESTMIARDLRIAQYESRPLHICHLHVEQSVEEVRRARNWGVDVSCEASPHHLLLTDEEVLTLDAARFKMSPPLAAEPHRQALIEGLRDGTIDCIATDHAPHHPAEKEVPFPAAPNGVIGLETAFPALVHGLVESGVVPLELIVQRMTAGPARAFGLERPRIAVGAVADLALWDLRERYTVSEDDLRSRSSNCAFLGREVQGRCLLTLAGGLTAHAAKAGVAA
ncbi:MAG TPA: dihydroorotase [Gaiellales bacterium]|nr:dihydroorotase [Gaiellales bacterium]